MRCTAGQRLPASACTSCRRWSVPAHQRRRNPRRRRAGYEVPKTVPEVTCQGPRDVQGTCQPNHPLSNTSKGRYWLPVCRIRPCAFMARPLCPGSSSSRTLFVPSSLRPLLSPNFAASREKGELPPVGIDDSARDIGASCVLPACLLTADGDSATARRTRASCAVVCVDSVPRQGSVYPMVVWCGWRWCVHNTNHP